MPVSALPSRHGCGSFGKEAYQFVDLLAKSGLTIWQILPLNPLGYGNSPYQPYSSYAIDDIYLSLDFLYDQNLLKKRPPSFQRRTKYVDYPAVRAFREPYLKEAYHNFVPNHSYSVFAYQDWLRSYSVFMALKKKNDGKCWNEWPEDERDLPEKDKVNLKDFEEEIFYQVFLQYELFLQWKQLKQYANDRNIEIMGDIPFYVGLDSSDVWAKRENFLLDRDGRPAFIAGVPPDYFARYGQRWGNPIYDWDYMQKDHFTFWIERLSYTQRLFDIVRIDHFRAFDTYWKIPASCPTAVEGKWVEAPGYAFFDTLLKQNNEIKLVAEDLGDLRKEVHALRDHYHFRGMRVLEFSFHKDEMKDDRKHLLVYTGTHDNMPLEGWYLQQSSHEKGQLRKLLKDCGFKEKSFVRNAIAYCLSLPADMVIIPMADYLHASKEARLNTPGTVGGNNWRWRLHDMGLFAKEVKNIRYMLEKYGRGE